jgi:hypothetical protein
VRVVQFLTAWANAPFTIAFGVAASVALLQASGALSLLADDADHDVDADADGDLDHDAEADGDTDHDADEHSFLEVLGIGRIPFALVWQTGAIAFAITGLALNARFIGGGEPPPITLLWTMPVSIVAAFGSIAGAARLLGPLFTPKEATSRHALVGRAGVVISSRVTSEFGEVRLNDDHGHQVRLICRLAEGVEAPNQGAQVVVVEVEDNGKPVVTPI